MGIHVYVPEYREQTNLCHSSGTIHLFRFDIGSFIVLKFSTQSMLEGQGTLRDLAVSYLAVELQAHSIMPGFV